MALKGTCRVALVLMTMVAAAFAAKEPRTGISFPDTYKKIPLTKLGVRTKGPIKVYAVGQFQSNFMLKLNMGVSAEKMVSALVDALKPRCDNLGCGEEEINQFKSLLLEGLPNGAAKGTTLVFGTGSGKLTIVVNGKPIGKVSSKNLATSFEGVYTDKNAVCKLNSVEPTEDGEEEAFSFLKFDIWTALGVVAATNLLLLVWIVNSKAVICELNVYPIKSCAQQRVSTARVMARGFEGDRILQVTDKDGEPCTPREVDKVRLFHVQPTLNESHLTLHAPGMPPLEMDLATAKTTTRTVSVNEVPDRKFQLQDYGNTLAGWMQDATGISRCRVTGIPPDFDRQVQVNPAQGDAVPGPALVSLAEEAPFLLTNTSSLRDLNRRLKQRGKEAVDMRRFRPNIVVNGLKPWEEDSLKRVKIANVEFHVWQRCGRCSMTTVDRDSLERSGEPLATLNTFRERANGMRNFGMHLVPIVDGSVDNTISVGSKMEILEYDEDRRAEWKELCG